MHAFHKRQINYPREMSGKPVAHENPPIRQCHPAGNNRRPPGASPTSPMTIQKCHFPWLLGGRSSLQFFLVYSRREPQIELLEQDLLMLGWARDASTTDIDASPRWQDDVNKSNL